MTANTGIPLALTGETEGERLSDVTIADAINEMRDRSIGLAAAVRGMVTSDRQGVLYLVDDMVDGMQMLAEAFEAEWQLRIAEKRQ